MHVEVPEDWKFTSLEIAVLKEVRKFCQKQRVSELLSFAWRWTVQTDKMHMIGSSECDFDQLK